MVRFDYSDIGAKVYSRSFTAVCVFILLCLLIGWDNKDDIVEILKIVLGFVKYAIAIYTIPVSLQIAGDKAGLILEYLKIRGGVKK